MYRRLSFTVCVLLVLVGVSKFANAALLPSNGICSTTGVTLESIAAVTDVSKTNLLSKSYDSTSCLGVFKNANDDQHNLSNPAINIGQLDSGLLNGQGGLIDYMAFISDSDLQDFDGDGNATDPGWIYLANYQAGGNTEYRSLGPIGGQSLNIADLLTITISCTWQSGECVKGAWELRTKLDIIDKVQALLGKATFDHLTFALKASNDFAIYDFNFNDIFAAEKQRNAGSVLNFNTPYVLSGFFNTYDFSKINGKGKTIYNGLSHMNIAARDPSDPSTTQVPEPAAILLFGFGLLMMGRTARSRQKLRLA
ncbi:PEP-CTERM sorting domain-containing protein [Aliiglaciecola sp. CAU 1673]|uniref:PEP-CTERM sorting domain-containing protein n=1 Tax=Aliiglaciecola sp. CAU 1673 TaxID=3032595 RepID=UPI0023DC40A6|nr:PEP-CTERM sorting domain-containing protein [Aliiglaciecola sp. CAU 1673]MDF2177013.1 PEP-CTERM sorting domain-containing protein [Aliiglaciecola sp. CAU 1673]